VSTQIHPRKQRLNNLSAQLKNELQSFIPQYRDLGDYILPNRPRFYTSDINKGERRNLKIIDSTATMGARTLTSGMMSGITSPARTWARLMTPDPSLNEFGSVKKWLHDVTSILFYFYGRSNLYNSLPNVYGDTGVFGTSALFVEEDDEDLLRTYSFPVGSYRIAKDFKGRINVFDRDFKMTVRQIVEQFGRRNASGRADWSNISKHVKDAWDNSNYEQWIEVRHVVQPNEEYDSKAAKLISKHKRFYSCYYESGTQGDKANYLQNKDDGTYLRESGYDNHPVLCPRWQTTGEDVYGTSCPGMIALGDIKALQLLHLRKAEAIEKVVRPPLIGPMAMKGSRVSLVPGDISWGDLDAARGGLRPIFDVNPQLEGLMLDIRDHQKRIDDAFFVPLFLMLANTDRREITAREIDERAEEKLLVLGPVLEQMNQDLLDPLVALSFGYALKQGVIPKPPRELNGMPLKVEYISQMSQAQKMIGIGALERFIGFVSNVGQVHQQIWDKVDVMQAADEYADMTGVTPKIVRTDEQVEQIQLNRAKAEQAAAAAQAIQAGAAAAKDLSQANLEGKNALTEIVKPASAGGQ